MYVLAVLGRQIQIAFPECHNMNRTGTLSFIPSGRFEITRSCGPVLLPELDLDYVEVPTCPWCLVRQAGGRLPNLSFVRAHLQERWLWLPVYFAAYLKK